MKLQSSLFVTACALVALCAPTLSHGSVAIASTPPPSPPPLAAPSSSPAENPLSPAVVPSAAPTFPTPQITPIPLFHGHGSAPAPTPKPVVDKRKGISGVWEVQIQREGKRTQYTHFKLDQASSDALTGEYMDANGKKYPLEGSVDGKHMRVIVSLPDGSTLLFQSTLDGTTDMLGLLTDPKGEIPFTAEYRPKENWLENITPGGGLGGIGGGANTGAGGGLPPR